VVNLAIGNWNNVIKDAKGFNVPTLAYAASGGIPVYFPANTSPDGEFCGTTTPGTGQVTKITLMRLGEGSACTASQRGSLSQVLTHEIAHVLGLNQQHGGVAARSSPLTSTGCTSYLPTGQGYGNLTAQVCYHEVETIIRARSGTGYAYDSSFYSAPLTLSTNVTPRTVSVDAGNSHTFSVSEWYLKPYGSLANGPTSLSWVTFDTTKAKVLAAGVVEGRQGAVGQGPVKVYLRGGALPTGHAWWTPFRVRGDSIALTVTAPPPPPPPPPPPFKADSIWASPMPITTPGWTTIQASVVGAPGTPVAIRWIVVDSRTPTVADTNVYYGLQMDLNVSSGSYTLAIRARPQYGSTNGLEAYQDIPVCTESGGALRTKNGGGQGTNAVENCPPP